MSRDLDFRLLGPVEVVDGGRSLPLGGRRPRSVLAILLLSANRVVSIDRLADDLYGEAPPATAITQVQRQVSDLRRVLGAAIETRAPGYLIRVQHDGVDLERFERWAGEGVEQLARGNHQLAAARLRAALELWRGPPLADLAFEPFASAAVARLNELRLAAVERRIEAELGLGLHRQLIAELESLVTDEPTHERFRAQLVLALYRSGRQEAALAGYRAHRRFLADQFGIEPSPELARLERMILQHDPSLELAEAAPPAEAGRSVLVCGDPRSPLEAMAALAAPLTRGSNRELLLIELLHDEHELEPATVALARWRRSVGVSARAAAFVSHDWPADIARLVAGHDVDLVLAAVPDALLSPGPLPSRVAGLLDGVSADVALLAGGESRRGGTAVVVAFAGGEHDWAALELGAWLAASSDVPLRLVAPRGSGEADVAGSSRLLAAASLTVQRTVGIDVTPMLADPGSAAVVAAAREACALLVGLSPGWRRSGVGTARRSLASDVAAPVLLVHRGPRPGGLAPVGSATRFTWSLGS